MIRYFVRHATAANLLLALMVLLGVVGAASIRSQLLPDVETNSVRVSVIWRGAGPEAVDTGVVQLLEPALREVEGVERVVSIARQNRADITLTLAPGRDPAAAADEAAAAVATVTALPRNIEPPQIRWVPWRDQVTDVAIHGPVAREQIVRFGDELADRLREAGLTRVEVLGVPQPVIRVAVPEASTIRHDLGLREIAAVVGDAARSHAGGETGDGGARLRAGAERQSPEAVADLVLRAGPEGESLRLRDVAAVEDAGLERGQSFHVEGDPAVRVRVQRDVNGDSLKMFAEVERIVAEMRPTLPAGVEMTLIHASAGLIAERLAILLDNAAMGLLLVLGLLFLFLNARTAFWVAAGIPAALLAAVGMMWALGVTLNLVSLFALIIVLGMVVDDAIVVGERADALARSGLRPIAAAEGAATGMAAPVFAATITTVIAFSALLVVDGRFGAMIEDIPVVVSLVLLASLVESLLVLPNHMRHGAAAVHRRAWYDAPSRVVNAGLGWFRERLFRPFMARVIRLRYPVLGAAILLLTSTVQMLVDGEVPWRFWNAPERNSFSGNVAMVSTATRDDTLAQMRLMEEAVREVGAELEAETGVNPIRFVSVQIGWGAGRGLAIAEGKDHWLLGALDVELIDADERPQSSAEIVRLVQDRVRRHPLAEAVTFRGARAGPGSDSISVRLQGAEPAVLKAAAEALKLELSGFPEVSGLEDTLAYDKTEQVLELTPLGRALGFTPESLGAELSNRLTGIRAAEFAVGPRTGVILVVTPREERGADFLHTTRLRAPTGDWVPLASVATASSAPGFASLRREDGRLTVSVYGDLSEDDPARAAEIDRRLTDEILPSVSERFDVSWEFDGLKRQEREFLSDAAFGAAVALAGIFLALAWVFASWTRPFAILLVVPFGLIGAVWGHHVWEVPLTMFSVVGLIGMIGIIINDSIVLISAVDEGAERKALSVAVLDAACDRLRPVLLTTLTTVLGLAPLLYETSSQAQFLKPTVITLAYGLGFGMVLVLLVTPALVMFQRDVAAAFTSLRRMTRLIRRPRRAVRPAE